MATKIFPSVNDINGGVAGQGKTLTEANLRTLQAMPYFDKPYVKSGAVCTNGGGLNLNVATGSYMIDGRWVYKDITESVLLTASATNRVWLQLQKDGSGNVTGTTWNVQTGTTVPADAVLVAVVVTAASTITTISATYRGIIQPGKTMLRQEYPTTIAGTSAAGTVTNLEQVTVVGDLITPVTIERFEPRIYTNVQGDYRLEIFQGIWSDILLSSASTYAPAASAPVTGLARRTQVLWGGSQVFSMYGRNQSAPGSPTITYERGTTNPAVVTFTFDF